MLGDLRTEMTYDYVGRRARKLVLELVDGEGPPTGSNPWGGNDGLVVDDMRYIYDGWNVVIERRVTDRTTVGEYPETAVRKYAWGLDLSGLNGAAASGNVQSAVHGAGGIGGLLAIEDFTTQIGYENSRACIYFYDGNGNVGQLVTWKTGDPELVEEPGQLPWTPFNLPGRVAERYEYDPYGGTLLADDDYAVDNPFRFSTKFYDAQPSTAAAGERGLYYYGYRYYSPRLGRWVNRDPIGEDGGTELYGFVNNRPNTFVDPHGLHAFPLGILPALSNNTACCKFKTFRTSAMTFAAMIERGQQTITCPESQSPRSCCECEYKNAPLTRITSASRGPCCSCEYRVFLDGYGAAASHTYFAIKCTGDNNWTTVDRFPKTNNGNFFQDEIWTPADTQWRLFQDSFVNDPIHTVYRSGRIDCDTAKLIKADMIRIGNLPSGATGTWKWDCRSWACGKYDYWTGEGYPGY